MSVSLHSPFVHLLSSSPFRRPGDAIKLSEQECSVLLMANADQHFSKAICAKQSHLPGWWCEAGLGKVWTEVAVEGCAAPVYRNRQDAVCPVLQNSVAKQQNVAAACLLQSRASEDSCQAGLNEVWEVVTAVECTGEEIMLTEDACSVLLQTNAKRQVVNTICSKQSRMPSWSCNAGLGKVWEDVALKSCSMYHSSERREAVCPFLQNGGTQQKQVHEVCSLQSHVSADKCENGMTQVWQVVTAAECYGKIGQNA